MGLDFLDIQYVCPSLTRISFIVLRTAEGVAIMSSSLYCVLPVNLKDMVLNSLVLMGVGVDSILRF